MLSQYQFVRLVDRLKSYGRLCLAVTLIARGSNGFFTAWSLLSLLLFCQSSMAGYEEDVTLLAAEGNPQAQYALALLYEYGTPTMEKSPEKSVELFRKAALKGVAGACLYLGIKYEHGSDISRDLEKAANCYRCAAAQEWPMAQYFLAGMYLKGKGVTKSPVKALAWYGLARDQGYPKAGEEYLTLEKQVRLSNIANLPAIQKDLLTKSQQFCD